MSEPRFFYGGQAVIEGVMIRGRRHYSLAVRRANGEVDTLCQPLNSLFTGLWRRVPFLRGFVVLMETLFLGIKCLNRSAVMAAADQSDDEEEMPRWVLAGTVAISLVFGIGLFFVLPLFAVRAFDHAITSDILSNFIEGVIRLVILVAYISAIGMMSDVRRVFAYHGAEHMAVHTHEAGLPSGCGACTTFPHGPSTVRNGLLADRDGGRDPRLRLPRETRLGVAHSVTDSAATGDRCFQLRNHPVLRCSRQQPGHQGRHVLGADAAASYHEATGRRAD